MTKRTDWRMLTVMLATLAIAGCRRGELPVPPHEAGSVTTATVDMDPLYKYQVYFNLRDNIVAGRSEKNKWDLGFDATAGGFHVTVNSAKSMFVLATAKTDFSSVTTSDTMGFSVNRKWDAYMGSLDSTAVGDWRIDKPVYIVDRGYSETGVHQGWAKVQFLSVSDVAYNVRCSKLDGTNEATVTIAKDSAYSLSYLSLTTNTQVMVAPPKVAWDIVFTQYTFIFYDMQPPTPYLVTGCLLNRYKTFAYQDTTNAFENITFSTVQNERLLYDISAIGYDWKVFNGTKYTIRNENRYVIRDANGLYYKLRFTGFYNAAGIKGNPQWEYQRL